MHLNLTQVILEILFVWRDLTPRCEWYEQALGIFTGTMLITLFPEITVRTTYWFKPLYQHFLGAALKDTCLFLGYFLT